MSSEAFNLFLPYLHADHCALKSAVNMTDRVLWGEVGDSQRSFNWFLVEMEPQPRLASSLVSLFFFSLSFCLLSTSVAGTSQLWRYRTCAANAMACEISLASRRDNVCPAAAQTGCGLQESVAR